MEVYRGYHLAFKMKNDWEYVERVGCDSAVVIIPITMDGNVILVEQMRHPIGRPVIEFPAGLVGDNDKGELVIDAAVRELHEETGYMPVAKGYEYLGQFPTPPGLTNEKVHMIRMLVMKDPDIIPEEGITVHSVPLEDLNIFCNSMTEADVSIKVLLYSLKYESF